MITQAWLKDHFDYEDGWLIVKKKWNYSGYTWVGKKVGYMNSAYLGTRINGELYYVHKLIWFWHYGIWPDELDHIDRNELNNRIENLREVTHSENQHNRGVFAKNVLGIMGIYPQKYGYRAVLHLNRKQYSKRTKTLEEAVIARREMEEKYHPFGLQNAAQQ